MGKSYKRKTLLWYNLENKEHKFKIGKFNMKKIITKEHKVTI